MTERAGRRTPPRVGLSDEELVCRVTAGSRRSSVLMRRYNQRLFRVARAILRDEGEAEDVMQQAYVNSYAHLGQFAERARFGTWLTRIAVHEALGRLRRRGRFEEADAMPDWEERTMDLIGAAERNPEQQALRGEMRAILEAAFEAIPEIYRTVFMLREVEGLSTADAAECLSVSEDVVKTRFFRARAGPPRSRSARAAALQLPRRRVPRGRIFAGQRPDGILTALHLSLNHRGEMREWLNRRDWKSREPVTPAPRVRIPLSPPLQ